MNLFLRSRTFSVRTAGVAFIGAALFQAGSAGVARADYSANVFGSAIADAIMMGSDVHYFNSGNVTIGTASGSTSAAQSFYHYYDEEVPRVVTGDGHGNSFATAGAGSLHAFGGGGGSGGGGGFGSGGGTAHAGFQDSVVFSSDLLPIGTPVQVEVTSHFHVVLTPYQNDGVHSTDASASYGSSIYLGSTLLFQHNVNALPDGSPLVTGNYDKTSVINTFVGSALDITGVLDVNASAGNATASADASQTGTLSFAPITPGVTLISDGGGTYAAVPEPATLALLAIPALSLLAGRRHRPGN